MKRHGEHTILECKNWICIETELKLDRFIQLTHSLMVPNKGEEKNDENSE